MKKVTFQSVVVKKRQNIEASISGRAVFDILPYMQLNHKLSSYKLNLLSIKFLN